MEKQMGCDIHAYVEKRTSKGYWKLVKEISIGRHYDLFSVLCGVRDFYRAIPIIPPNRSIPDDISKGVAREYERWDADAHSETYMTLEDWDAYTYWDTVFPDTRQPIDSNATNTAKSGGTLSWEEKKVKPDDYKKMTPREALEGSCIHDIIAFMREIAKLTAVRLVFWFDN